MSTAACEPDRVTGAGPKRAAKWADASIELVRASRGHPPRLSRVFDQSPIPMVMEKIWARLARFGLASGRSEIASPPDAHLEICYLVTASAVPDRYLATFAPAGWPEDELLSEQKLRSAGTVSPLNRREIEVLDSSPKDSPPR